MVEGGIRTLIERAAAILCDEIANGALANIATASQLWPAHRRDRMTPEATRRPETDYGGLLDTVLDLLAPRPPAAVPYRAADRRQQTIEPLPVLRARRSVPPGGAAEIHTGLRNDGPTPVEVGFVWSDLVAEPDGRIHAGCLRLPPGRVRVQPGAFVGLAIGLDVPNDAQPGLYHALLQATELGGLRALLMFPVALNVERETSAAS
jgi:hypothetical protein